MSAIRLLSSERAPRGASAATLARLQRVAVAAVEQSQRSVVPRVSGTHEFAELPNLLEPLDASLFLQPGAAAPCGGASVERAAILVGPEGGWTPGEIDQLESWGCRPVGLGPTVLRIETAAIVGCASLLIHPQGR